MDETQWAAMTEEERNKLMDEAFVYDEELKRTGHLIGGEALQLSQNPVTLRYHHGKVSVTDGPFVETKEHLGGILLLEARDLNHAIQLMSNHPSLRMGSIREIRPAADLTEMIAESEKRRFGANHS